VNNKCNKHKKITQAKNKHCVRFFTQPTQASAIRNGRSKQPIIEAANQGLALLAVFVYTMHASHAMQALALRAFEWKPGFML